MNWRKDSLGYNEFVAPIALIAEGLEETTVKHYLEVKVEDTDGCSRVILSGTALKDYASMRQPGKFDWIKELKSPVFGICAGMQIIGLVFGSKLTKCSEIGMTQIATLKENPLFSGTFKAYSLHTYCVEPSGDFEVLAESTKCVQAIKHKEKQIYGVLFHSEARNVDILKHFMQLKY
jgi:GMP synthase-like glutamine amidotransferase